MATTDDTRVHQPLYLQQSGVWGINKSPVCREIYNHRLTTQGRARTATAPQSAQALSSVPTPAFRPPRSRAPLARISRTWRRPSSAPPPCSGPRSARRGAARSASRLLEPSLREPAGASDPVCGPKRRLTHDGARPIARGDGTARPMGSRRSPARPSLPSTSSSFAGRQPTADAGRRDSCARTLARALPVLLRTQKGYTVSNVTTSERLCGLPYGVRLEFEPLGMRQNLRKSLWSGPGGARLSYLRSRGRGRWISAFGDPKGKKYKKED